MTENALSVEKEKTVLPHHHLDHQQQPTQLHHYTSIHPGVKSLSLSEETIKHPQQLPPAPKMNTVLPLDLAKSKIRPSPNTNSSQFDTILQKSQHPNTNPTDLFKVKPQPGQLENSKPKPYTSPEISKHKIHRYSNISPTQSGRVHTTLESAESSRSSFKPVPVRFESSGDGTSSSSSSSNITKSPLIIDKNETFTVYRDPALVRSDADNSASATVSSNHVAAYLHSHLHSPCLSPASHPHAASHLLIPSHTSPLPHPHLLPPGVLPAISAPSASLLGGHPRLDSSGGLGHLPLTHPAAAHQQQFLQV